MVRIFSMYHFNGQMVDTVDDMSTLTVTDHNKLLIAQDNYSVEVKDLLSDMKKPLLVFSTVEKVHRICHCAHGNYVATVEGKQEFQKSDRLIVRIYTNWELDFTTGESRKSKRLVRARIAGVVTPSSAIADEDFLDMIEIPISFTSPILLTVCQSTGKLLVTCGPTMHLFYQIYTRNNHGKSSYFMDFLPFVEVFQLDFLPIEVVISENIIASYSQEFVSVFKVKKLNENDLEELSKDFNVSPPENVPFVTEEKNVLKALNLSYLLRMVRENREDRITKFIDPRSLPLMVSLKGINDNIISVRAKRLPFKFFDKKNDCRYRNGKVKDTLVETLCDKDLSVVAESILALHIQDPDELITKVALQVLCRSNADSDDTDQQNLTENNDNFVCMNILVTTYQEGYLFYASTTDLQESLRCVAVFNFTSQVMSLMFEVCFLHVLTQTGLETYSIPSLHTTVLQENEDLDKFSQYVSIVGMHPFMGIVDFIGSKDLIVILTSASDGKRGKESLPWTVYSLNKPKLFEVYKEMIENSNSFKTRDDSTYRYLSLESFLILQIGLNLSLNVCEDIDDTLVRSTHRINSLELAKILFRSGNDSDVQIGSSVILAASLDPIDFIRSLEIEGCEVSNGKALLMKRWISQQNDLSEEQVEWLIKTFDESNDIEELSSLILSNKTICHSSGRRAISCLKAHVAANEGNSNVQVIYTLAILYTQECLQNEAVKILSYVKAGDEAYRKSFVGVILKFWRFLFDEIRSNGKDKVVLSDVSSLLCENLPGETGEILGELILKENAFDIFHVVQMLMMQFPCHVSVQKSTYILQTVLEKVFSSNIQLDCNDSNIKNCLKILARSYLSELMKDNVVVHEVSVNDSRPMFFEKLPSYVDMLPTVSNVNQVTLRRFQELIWSQKLDEESMKEILNPISNVSLKLNLLAMLNDPEFAENLIEHNCFDAVLPYAKSSFNSVKKWRDFISFIQQKIAEQKEREENANASQCEKVLKDILDHLALNLTPSQLNAVLDSTISKDDELYWHSMVRAQQISFANEVKEMILNTSQQLLQSNAVN